MSNAFLSGQMMEQPLLIPSILEHAQRHHASTEVISARPAGAPHRSTWGTVAGRAAQLAHALSVLGVGPGDRVGTLAWNTSRHLEVYYAVPGLGAVLHTINPRLFLDQLVYILQSAEDRVVFLDPQLLGLAATLAERVPAVRHWVVLCDAAELAMAAAEAGAVASEVARLPGLRDYESFITGFPSHIDWPVQEETSAAALCYTSGTTGNPKGVLYSHRSTLLHSLVSVAPDVLGLSARDCVLPVVPMFHVNAWGLPFSTAMVGCKLVLPGARLDGDSLFDLLDQERVTLSVGVPTVWLGLLQAMRARGRKPVALARLMVGGSACPPALSDAYVSEFGIDVLHGWGMTETSPIAALSSPRHDTAADKAATLRYCQGRPLFGIQVRVVDGEGKELPQDGKAAGDLQVRGHWVADSYFPLTPAASTASPESPASTASPASPADPASPANSTSSADPADSASLAEPTDAAAPAGRGSALVDGWFPTGDVAQVDAEGFILLTDRSKDVIKSGGEWISSIALENAALAHPGVLEAAAIGVPHPKWDERPLLLVVPREGASPSAEEILATLAERTARWCLPDAVIFVQSLPHTATGKLSKLTLRQQYRDYRFPAD